MTPPETAGNGNETLSELLVDLAAGGVPPDRVAARAARFLSTVPGAPPGTEPSRPRTSGERYELAGLLGSGGMGRVDAMVDLRLGRQVARKVLRPDRLDALTRLRFEREARVLARLEHPNIVPVYDLVEGAAGPELYMRRVDGRPLDAVLEAGELPDLRARLDVFLRVCDAVAFAHGRGVVHRDLKPGNIMLGTFGEVLVVDWGLAGVSGEAPTGEGAREDEPGDVRLTRHGQVFGTARYMSPEQARGDAAAVGPASDQYALGVILYELLTGRAPFGGASVEETLDAVIAGRFVAPRELAPSVPRELEVVTLRALSPDPADRYPSVQELRSEVAAFLAGRPLASVRYTAAERLGRWVRRRWGTIRWVALVGAVAISGAVVVQARHVDALEAARAAEARAREGEATAHAETLRQLLESQLREVDQIPAADPNRRRAALLAARATADRVGGPDDGVEVRLSLLDHRSPPPLYAWAAHSNGTPAGVAVAPDGGWALSWTREGEIAAWALPDGRELWRRPAAGPIGAGFVGAEARVATYDAARGVVELRSADRQGVRDLVATVPAPGREGVVTVGVPEGGGEIVLVHGGEMLGHERIGLDGSPLGPPAGTGWIQRRASPRWVFATDATTQKYLVDARTGRRQGPFGELLSIDDAGFTTWDDGVERAWAFGATAPLWEAPAPHSTEGVRLPGMGAIASFGAANGVELRGAADGRPVGRLPVVRPAAVAEVPGLGVLALDGEGRLAVWPLGPPRPGPVGGPGLRGAAWSDDGRWLAVADRQGVAIRDTSAEQGFRPVGVPGRGCRGVTFVGAEVLLSCGEGGVFAVPLGVGSPRALLDWPRAWLLAPLGGGSVLVSSQDGEARRLDLATGQASAPFPVHTGAPWALVADPATGKVLSTGRDQRDRRVVTWHGDGVIDRAVPFAAVPFAAALDPARDWVGVSDDAGGVTSWAWSAADPVTTRFSAHDGVVLALAAAGGRIATSGLEGEVRLWTPTGRRLGSFDAGAQVVEVRFAPDGERLAWAAGDGPARVLDLSLEAHLEAADAALAAHPDDPAALAAAIRVRREALDVLPPP